MPKPMATSMAKGMAKKKFHWAMPSSPVLVSKAVV